MHLYSDSPVEAAARPHKPSPEEELEQLIAEKNTQPMENTPLGLPLSEGPISSHKRTVSNDDAESQLEQLMFEKQQEMSMDQTGPPLVHENAFAVSHANKENPPNSGVRHKPPNQFQSAPIFKMPATQEKENIPSFGNKENTVKVKKEQFDFTPTTGIIIPRPA